MLDKICTGLKILGKHIDYFIPLALGQLRQIFYWKRQHAAFVCNGHHISSGKIAGNMNRYQRQGTGRQADKRLSLLVPGVKVFKLGYKPIPGRTGNQKLLRWRAHKRRDKLGLGRILKIPGQRCSMTACRRHTINRCCINPAGGIQEHGRLVAPTLSGNEKAVTGFIVQILGLDIMAFGHPDPTLTGQNYGDRFHRPPVNGSNNPGLLTYHNLCSARVAKSLAICLELFSYKCFEPGF